MVYLIKFDFMYKRFLSNSNPSLSKTCDYGFKVMKFKDISLIEDFLIKESVSDTTGQKCISIHNSLDFLLDQKRFIKENPEYALKYLRNVEIAPTNPLSDVISSLTDEQILSTVKPRHLNTPYDLLNWSSHLTSLYRQRSESFSTDVHDYISGVINKKRPQPNQSKSE